MIENLRKRKRTEKSSNVYQYVDIIPPKEEYSLWSSVDGSEILQVMEMWWSINYYHPQLVAFPEVLFTINVRTAHVPGLVFSRLFFATLCSIIHEAIGAVRARGGFFGSGWVGIPFCSLGNFNIPNSGWGKKSAKKNRKMTRKLEKNGVFFKYKRPYSVGMVGLFWMWFLEALH